MTLVEVAIACSLLVAVLLVAISSNATIEGLIHTGETEAGTVGRVREVLYQLRQDLGASSMVEDPVSGEPRFRIEAAASGGQRLRLRRIEGASLQAGSLTAVWTPWITWEMDAEGVVSRTVEGQPGRVVARAMGSLAFEAIGGRVISVTCRSSDRDVRGVRVTPVQLSEVVLPRH